MKFNKNDKVKVVDDGQLYDTHPIGKDYLGWVYARKPRRKTKYRILGCHNIGTETIYAIENASGQVYLYGESGLELLSSPKPSPAPEPFTYPTWVEIKPYDGVDKKGLVVDLRHYGKANQPACWLTDEGRGWACNSSFKVHLPPIEAAMMLLALHEVEENRP
jgi:hypothetical protein